MVRHAEAKASVFEQIVAKPHGGRPEGGISRAARELPIPGKTLLGRRRYIERAIKIDCILPEAKSAARAAGLDNTQCDLLAIAHEHSPEAQLAKVKEIAARRSAPRRKSSKSIQSATADMLPIQQEPVYIPEMTVGGDGTITAEQEAQFTSLRTSWRIDQVLRRQEFEGASAVAQQSFIREELLGNSVIHRKGNDHD